MRTGLPLPEIYKLFKACARVHTDSRTIQTGDFFVALKGERFDGNVYAAQALEKGAAFALVSDASLPQDDRLILVKDTLKSLQQLATYHRRTFSVPVIGITGSNGKTTTKELIYQVLATTYRTHCTQGNLNNHIGVPLTLLKMPENIEIAVIEMGANHQGEIDLLCHIAEPTHGLITNIGKAHLEGFGGIEGVKKGKSEMYRYLNKTAGVVFVNMNMDFLRGLVPPETRVVEYGSTTVDSSATKGYIKQTEPVVLASWQSKKEILITATAQIGGIYNFQNIMTAVAIGQYFDVPDEQIQSAIESYVPSNNRSQVLAKEGITFHLDAYNANPTSMLAALQHFEGLKAPLKIVILGDMLELGTDSQKEHQAVLDRALQLNMSHILLVGRHFQKVHAEDNRVQFFPDIEAVAHWIKTQSLDGAHLLLKGSRKLALEKLLEFF